MRNKTIFVQSFQTHLALEIELIHHFYKNQGRKCCQETQNLMLSYLQENILNKHNN